MLPKIVSCSPRLYEGGGFFDDRSRLDAAPGELILSDDVEVFPGFSYGRPELDGRILGASESETAIRAHMDFVANVFRNGPSTRLVKLRDVHVVGDMIVAIRDGEPVVLAETARAIDAGDDFPDEISADRLRSTATHVAGANPLYVGSSGFRNYGHWLIDDLPRLAAVPDLVRASGQRVDLFLRQSDDKLDEVKRASIYLAAPYGTIASTILIPRATTLHFDELWYVTPTSLHPALKSPAACRFLRGLVRRFGGVRPGAADAIFVRRSRDRGRILVNEDDLAPVLQAHGVTPIDPEKMTFVEQLLAFGAANRVVGTMGAALTSAVFCEAGAQLLCLAPDGWTEPFYWDLAAASGLDYRAIYGPSQRDCPPEQRNFRIDPRHLEAALGQMMASPNVRASGAEASRT